MSIKPQKRGENRSLLHSLMNIKVVVQLYLLMLLVFTFFRAVLFFTQIDKLQESSSFLTILKAFIMGVRFDTVIACYILALTYILLSVKWLANIRAKWFREVIFWYTFLAFTASVMVSGADIPYFEQFYSRFSITAFEWMDNPVFVFKMIFEEPRLWLFVLPVIAVIVLLYKLFRRIFVLPIDDRKRATPLTIAFSVLFIGVIFIGMRGRLDEKSPIRIGTAYFSDDSFLNQLGLNPNFTLLKSYLENKKAANKPIQLMNEEKAIKLVQKHLGFTSEEGKHPLYRQENKEGEAHKKNVVVVLMESMSAGKMKRHGSKHDITPFLDSLSHEGYYFENAYSAGIHTFNGIFSSLFSYPALFRRHPMKVVDIPNLKGMGTAMKQQGYSTTYFTTHDGQFDNVEGFLRGNDYDNIITKADYPKEKVKTTLGVPDDYMFEFAMPILDDLAGENEPFFTVFMTASDHKPYYIPPYFTPKASAIEHQIVEYADYSLRRLIEMAQERDWFENTLFVFVADHGSAMGATYDVSLNYNHVPLLFYGPEIIKESTSFQRMAGQIDLFPSVMGLLNLPFENYSLGVNLFEHERPYIYFNVDDKFAVIDQEWLLIVREDQVGLYNYPDKDKKSYAEEQADRARKMREYAEAQMQMYQLVEKGR